AAVDLSAGEDRHCLAVDEADAAAEVRDDVLVEAEAEREDVVALDEERPLLGKELGEARQVRAPRIDFGFREVGVHRAGREDVRADALADVEARLELPIRVRVGRWNPAAARDRGTDRESEAEIEVRQIGQQARAARLRDLILTIRRRPAIRL